MNPYERRIDKITLVDGSFYFKVLYLSFGHWFPLTRKTFKTFGDAVVWVKQYDAGQVDNIKTASKF